MTAYSAQIEKCIQKYEQGKREHAFHSLTKADDDILPELIDAFNNESKAEIQAFLVQVIWQHREPSIIPFLGSLLSSSGPLIWKEALDGLVTLASPEALEALISARSRNFPRKQDTEEFQEWLEEAIEQVRGILPGA
jgi:hypothetical protein